MEIPILECKNVSKYFGDFAAVKDLSFEVSSGEVYGIAGPNGAGKTTLFNAITSVTLSATSGKILLDSVEIQRLKSHQICHMGIARTFQIPHVFDNFTYLGNVMIGSIFGGGKHGTSHLRTLLKRDGKSLEERAIRSLGAVGLLERKDEPARGAALFDIKRLMLASALATEPRLVLLDEPVGGLNRQEIDQIINLIRRLKEQGITFAIIEHIMTALMSVSDRVMILHRGQKLCEGEPREVGRNKAAIEAYLGEEFKSVAEGKTNAGSEAN